MGDLVEASLAPRYSFEFGGTLDGRRGRQGTSQPQLWKARLRIFLPKGWSLEQHCQVGGRLLESEAASLLTSLQDH
jgi:hypothetical protein